MITPEMISQMEHEQAKQAPKILTEEDEPFEHTLTDKLPGITQDVSPEKIKSMEKNLSAMTKMFDMKIKQDGFKLIILCLAILLGIYAVDIGIMLFGKTNSELTTGLFDFLKTIITALLGYVFGTSKNSD